jgi:hypothetical protein
VSELRAVLHVRVTPGCWAAERLEGAGPCDGALIRAHLIPKQLIDRELRARFGGTVPRAVLWDPRVWVPMCGGPTGVGGHHGRVDGRQLAIPRRLLPPELEEFAREHRLEWRLDHDYGRDV